MTDRATFERNAKRLARYKAKLSPTLEQHIDDHAWSDVMPCRCSVCAWRRIHVHSIVYSLHRAADAGGEAAIEDLL